MKAAVGHLELEYDTFGDPAGEPVLLIMGLATQMTAWPVRLCEMLAERGFYVIRFDNRDIGLSTHLDDLGNPSIARLVLRLQGAPYSLDDMAADAVGLLDQLGIDRAHVVGASMGGMIAQLVAINHPSRVLSLTSIMSGVGGRDQVRPPLAGIGVLLKPRPRDRQAGIRRQLEVRRFLAGGNPIDEALELKMAEAMVDRSLHPAGAVRQLAAIMRAPSRRSRLRSLAVPVLVIHGADDPLVPVENGRRTARAIPNARLLIIERMGHNLPNHAWSVVVDAITDIANEAKPLKAAG
ncbi:MAG TPA: alpha/beta hydrolase [Candidatus Dormibacteraeota bacterium]